MNLNTYLKAERGRGIRLCRTIGCFSGDLSRWANGIRPVPVHRALAIERATYGVVSRKDLRPDDWHVIWPEFSPPRTRRRAAAVLEAVV